MKGLGLFVALLFLLSKSALACTVTLNPGTNVISSAVNSGSNGDIICLNTGTYTQTATIQLKPGQSLEGLGVSRTDTVINSSASKAIELESSVTVYNFHLLGDPSSKPGVGVEGVGATNATIWSLLIERVVDGVGLYSSDNVNIWDVYTSNNGDSNNSKPDPSVFIYDSDDVEILYGYFEGASNGPGGDGEVACWGSNNLLIDGAHIVYSGASSIYFVDCDDSTVQYSNIYGGDEWGLDIVSGATAGQDGAPLYLDGTENFTAIGNTITNHYYGGSVFDETGNGSGTFIDNDFITNNLSTLRSCQGINVIGSTGNIVLSGNYANPTPLICSY